MEHYAATIDVRQFASKVKHQTIFAVLGALGSGRRLLLVNDHDPKPLFYQLSVEHPGEYEWTYMEEGPECWQVEIRKVDNDGRDANGQSLK